MQRKRLTINQVYNQLAGDWLIAAADGNLLAAKSESVEETLHISCLK